MKNIISADQYISGLSAIRKKVTEEHKLFFKIHYQAEFRTATAKEIATAAGVSRWTIVNLRYGRLGRIFCTQSGLKPDVRPDSTYRWWAIWCRGWTSPKGFVWQMLPQVAEALEKLNWVTPISPIRLPDEVNDKSELTEGTTYRISVNAYERNAQARKQCIDHYGAKCFICGFDFESSYGPIASGYIHVHHLHPLSKIGTKYIINPITDLRPVCPNCHSILHLGGQHRTIEEVQRLIQEH